MSAYLDWRGAELGSPVWQGIERLSMDTGVPGFEAVVTVHLTRPAAGMTAESVEVMGGRSIVLDRPEIAVTEGSTTIEVRFRHRGDHSPYSIRLRDGGNDPLHPFFAEAQFGFYIDCETGDCRPRPLVPAKSPKQPPSLDTRYKDFRGFMRMLSEWVRVANPDWADLAPASQERMLVELLAHQGDMLSYYQDRVANEAFIDTASQRHSLRQHATLLGYPLFEGRAARTLLAFAPTAPGFVPAGLSVENRRLHGERPVVFYVRDRTPVDPANNSAALVVAAWPGAAQATIPRGASTLLLWGQGVAMRRGMRLVLAQGDFLQVVTLTEVRRLELPGWVADPGDPLVPDDQTVTELGIDSPLESELRPWDAAVRLRMYANLADASHGAPREFRIAPAGAPPAPGVDVPPPLDRRNSIAVDVPRVGGTVTHLRAFQVPEGPVVHELDADGRSVPVLDVQVGDTRWTRREHLHASESFDTHYTAETENAGSVWIGFGDGVRGQAIEFDRPTGSPLVAIVVTYRIGEPLDGNCAPDTLTEVVTPAPDGFAALGSVDITNVTPGIGGKRKDTLDEIREAVPMSLRHGDLRRAVALADYAAIARLVPGVSRAAAKALGGPFNTVLVLIDPDEQAALSPELRDRVWRRIEETRMAGREHVVAPAEYVPLRVELVVCAEPGFLRHEVRDRVLAELRPGTNARRGYFHPNRLTFGQDLEAGDLLRVVQEIPGVRSVKLTAFCRLRARVVTVEDRIDFAATEVPRLDADDDFPEHGVLRVSVVGLDPVDEGIFAIEVAP